MKPMNLKIILTAALLLAPALASEASAADRVNIANGVIEATAAPSSGVRSFKGIPFAQPPVGELRWREPQRPKNWTGVRNADKFGPRCMQRTSPDSDYWFRSNGMSEDCLYLNVWTPAKLESERLPVLVYFFGGGLQNGDGSEPRYDGESMARKGIVVVTLSYRTNIFGFFSHPELTKESPHHSSGNYGLMDGNAALRWVQENIAAFGGDPKRVTVGGESAGSFSTSSQVASPLSKGLIAGAILESGGMMMSALPQHSLAETEQDGLKFAASVGAKSLGALRAMSAGQLQAAMAGSAFMRFSANTDGHFLPKQMWRIYEAGEQAHVPLLAGSNSEEASAESLLGSGTPPTAENFAAAVRRRYGKHADALLKVYAASTPAEVYRAATDLAGDHLHGQVVWKATEFHMKTSGKPVYRFYYTRPQPGFVGAPRPVAGAVHSAEIQYALGTLSVDTRYAWEPADFKLSEIMQGYFANFIKTGNPNGPGLPNWPAYNSETNHQRMRLGDEVRAEPEPHRARHLVLDTIVFTKP
jgi:para-nitrobenzyl esterase